LCRGARFGIWAGMSTADDKASREERLAAKLRENLRRRKSQARAMEAKDHAPLPKDEPKS